MELEFLRLEFHLFFSFFLVNVRLHPRGNGLELEFQKQSNLLKCFIRMLCSKFFFFLKSYYLANFAQEIRSNSCHKIKSTMESNQIHTTKSNSPTHTKKTKKKKKDREILALTSSIVLAIMKRQEERERNKAETNG